MKGVSKYSQVLSNGQFRRLWLAAFFARVGDSISQVALPLLVYDMTGSASLMSVIFIVKMLPQAFLSPFSGLLADSLDRRRLMIGASLLRAGAMACIPFANEPGQVAAIAAVAGLGSTLYLPAELAMLPSIVTPQELVPALSATQVMGAMTRIFGPALGAAIVGVAGPPPAFWAQAICFGVAVGWLYRLQPPQRELDREGARSIRDILAKAGSDIREGFRTIRDTPIVRGVCATEGLWSLVFAVFSVTMVVYTEESLDLGNRADLVYGLLLATMSAGAVLGALSASRIERRIGRPWMLAVGYLGPALMIPAGWTPPLSVLFLLWFAFGFADALAVIAMHAYLAESTPDELRGRVYAIWGGIIALSALVSYAVAGWMTDLIGAPGTVALTGLLVGIGGPLVLILTGALQSVIAQRRDRFEQRPEPKRA
jgi:MFS transporter, NRE family, putaive nickel resistance protein